ncbi:MAG: hypothetical protein AB7V26_12745 [Lysobacterales bacterium]
MIDGILYGNDGDWVENRSALTESFDGELRLWFLHDGEASAAASLDRRKLSPTAAQAAVAPR